MKMKYPTIPHSELNKRAQFLRCLVSSLDIYALVDSRNEQFILYSFYNGPKNHQENPIMSGFSLSVYFVDCNAHYTCLQLLTH